MSEELVFQYFFSHSGEARAGHATDLAIEAAAADASIWDAFHPMQVQRIGVLVTVAINYNVPTALMIMAFFRRVTYGSNTARVEMGRVTIPDGAVAGAVYYLDIPHAAAGDTGEVDAGEQVVSAIVQAGTGGGAIAGDFQPFVCWTPRGLNPAQNTNAAGVVTLIRDTTTVQV